MAKFKVGDRAKLIKAINHPQFTGKECTVVGVGVESVLGRKMDYAIVIDSVPNHPAGHWVVHEHQIEPIIELGSSSYKEESVPLGNWDELQKTINWNPTKETSHAE